MQLNGYEQAVFDGAVMFTAIRGATPASRTRQEFETLAEAEAAGVGDGRTMIYAVDASGRSAHLLNV